MLTLLAQFGNGLQAPGDRFNTYAGDSASGYNALDNAEYLISQLLGFLTVFASLFFIVYFFMGALKWTAAGGDAGKVSKARDQMIQGVVGLIVIVASYSVVGLIGQIIGLDILTPGDEFMKLIQ